MDLLDGAPAWRAERTICLTPMLPCAIARAFSAREWLALHRKMRASAGQDTPYLRILRRFVPE